MSITVYSDLALRLAEELFALPEIERVRVWLRADDIVIAAAELPPDGFVSSDLDAKEVADMIFRVAPLTDERGIEIGVGGVRHGFVEIPNIAELSPETVALVRARIDPVAAAFVGASALAEAEQPSRGKIMVVDDDEALCTLIERLLSRARFEVIAARNGRVAIEMAAREQPDLILMDWIMPLLDGRAATLALKREPSTRDIPIVMITSRSHAQDKIEALRAGVQDFLPKPFDYRELIARIEGLLRWRTLLAPSSKPASLAVAPPASNEDEVRTVVLEQLARAVRDGDAAVALEDAISQAEECEEKHLHADAAAAYKIAADAAGALGDGELENKLLRLSGRAYLAWAEVATESVEIQRGYSLSVRRFLEAGNLTLPRSEGDAPKGTG